MICRTCLDRRELPESCTPRCPRCVDGVTCCAEHSSGNSIACPECSVGCDGCGRGVDELHEVDGELYCDLCAASLVLLSQRMLDRHFWDHERAEDRERHERETA